MPPTYKLKMPGAVLLLSLLSVTGCATHTSTPSLPVEPARIPPLPQAARQPPAPAWCLPDCSTGVQTSYRAARQLLINPGSPGSPASAPTTR